jgi:hypothetical protein
VNLSHVITPPGNGLYEELFKVNVLMNQVLHGGEGSIDGPLPGAVEV